MNTPQHQRDKTESPSHVLPVSISDTPIYDGLVHATYGDQGGPLVDRQPASGAPTEPPVMVPAQPPLARSDTAEVLSQAPDGRWQVSGDLSTGALDAQVSSGGQVSPEDRRKRVPGTHMAAGLRRHGNKGRHHQPQVPDAKRAEPEPVPFPWHEPAQACGGGR